MQSLLVTTHAASQVLSASWGWLRIRPREVLTPSGPSGPGFGNPHHRPRPKAQPPLRGKEGGLWFAGDPGPVVNAGYPPPVWQRSQVDLFRLMSLEASNPGPWGFTPTPVWEE